MRLMLLVSKFVQMGGSREYPQLDEDWEEFGEFDSGGHLTLYNRPRKYFKG